MRARIARGIASLAALAALGACGSGGDTPGWTIFPDMLRSVPYDAYDPNPVTRNGQTLQVPPEGTVPMGSTPFPYGPGPEEALRAGRELTNPWAATPDAVQRGKHVYETVCIVCHGPRGEGDGPIIGRFPNPPSLLAERARTMADGQVFHVITRGQGIMPSHAAQVRAEDRWKAVLYLRAVQSPPAAPRAPAATSTVGGAP